MSPKRQVKPSHGGYNSLISISSFKTSDSQFFDKSMSEQFIYCKFMKQWN